MHIHLRAFKTRTSALALLTTLLGASMAFSASAQSQSATYAIELPAETLAQALTDLSRQTHCQILFPYEVAANLRAPAVVGTMSRDEALARLLVGSGLAIAQETDTTVSLKADAPSGTSEAPTEVIVTGTHIRGGNPTAPVHTVTRADIQASGYAEVGDVLRALPENFSGGQNPGVFGASGTNTANTNISSASTLNLRGLGTDATLVLVNGHRLGSDAYFQASDISGIPLAAVERVEIVPDGASAIYGSDAVGGVANLILRKAYTGAQLSARYGAASDGGGAERAFTALGGKAWDRGYVLANLDYFKQGAILASDRSFTATSEPANTLLPEQRRKSLYVGAGADLATNLSLDGDLLISDHETHYSQQALSYYPLAQYTVKTPSLTASLGLKGKLGQTWAFQVTGLASGSRNMDRSYYPAYDFTSDASFRNALRSIEASADGTVLALPSGDVKLAAGLGVRHETFKSAGLAIDRVRKVDYAFVEIEAPLVTPSATRRGLHELSVDLSARSEDYSDVGRSTTPRLGLRYVPFDDLTLRAAWGKSLKAPTLLQLYGQSYLVLRNASDVGGSGSGAILMTQGSNPDLRPETATSVTLGGDYHPAAVPSLHVSLNLFDIDFTDRVVTPVNNILNTLSDPIYAPYVEGAPSAAEQSDEMAKADVFYNFSSGAYDPAAVTALVRNLYANATSQRVRGTDLGYRQDFSWRGDALHVFANATWLDLDQQTLPTEPYQQLSGTIFNAPRWKSRIGATWRHQGLDLSAIYNYVGSETDTGVSPRTKIASWGTLDLNLSYRLRSGEAAQGPRLSLAVSNLFDKRPPYAESANLAIGGIYFDSTNASAIGRFVSVALTQVW